jgi:hypothetical protein
MQEAPILSLTVSDLTLADVLTAIFTWITHRYFVGRLALPSRYVMVWLMQLQTAVSGNIS